MLPARESVAYASGSSHFVYGFQSGPRTKPSLGRRAFCQVSWEIPCPSKCTEPSKVAIRIPPSVLELTWQGLHQAVTLEYWAGFVPPGGAVAAGGLICGNNNGKTFWGLL